MGAAGEGMVMFKACALLLLVGAIAGCAGAPAPEAGATADEQVPKGGCYQSEWQAETAPVINKRLGPEGLEKYEPEHQAQARGCP